MMTQCTAKITAAEAVATQATADLEVVTRLLVLQDAVAVRYDVYRVVGCGLASVERPLA